MVGGGGALGIQLRLRDLTVRDYVKSLVIMASGTSWDLSMKSKRCECGCLISGGTCVIIWSPCLVNRWEEGGREGGVACCVLEWKEVLWGGVWLPG